jgi:hypothetical protein
MELELHRGHFFERKKIEINISKFQKIPDVDYVELYQCEKSQFKNLGILGYTKKKNLTYFQKKIQY